LSGTHTIFFDIKYIVQKTRGEQMEIAVCDDNKEFLIGFESQLKTLFMVENVFAFSDLYTFLFSIDGGKRYDAVLMDIE